MAADEGAAQRVAHLIELLDVDRGQRRRGVLQPVGTGAQARVAEEPREQGQPRQRVDRAAGGDAQEAASTMAVAACSRSSWYFTAAPRVSRIVAASAGSLPSAASARAQSTVSATPGSL